MRAILVVLALMIAIPAARAATLEQPVQLHDDPLHIAPDAINAAVGDTLVLTVTNQGSIAHDLVVCGDGPTPPSSCNDKWGFVLPLEAGASAPLSAQMKKAGTFVYYCSIPGHAAGGMRGVLTVAGDADDKSTPSLAGIATLMTLAALALIVRRRT